MSLKMWLSLPGILYLLALPLVCWALAVDRVVANTNEDAEQLENKAVDLAAEGNFIEALEYAEYALRIQPDKLQLHLQMAGWCARLMRTYDSTACKKSGDPAAPQGTEPNKTDSTFDPSDWDSRRRYSMLALDHLRRFADQSPLTDEFAESFKSLYSATTVINYNWDVDKCSFTEKQRSIARAKLNLAKYVLEKGLNQTDTLPRYFLSKIADGCAHVYSERCPVLLEERLDVIDDLLGRFAIFPMGFDGQCMLLSQSFSFDLGKKHFENFNLAINRLARAKDAQSQLTVQIARLAVAMTDASEAEAMNKAVDDLLASTFPELPAKEISQFGARVLVSGCSSRLGRKAPRPAEETPCSDRPGVLIPVELNAKGESRTLESFHLSSWGGWCACGEGLDIVHSDVELYSIRTPGELEEIKLPSTEARARVGHVAWDGKYVWVVNSDAETPIVVLDGESLAMVATFGPQDGVPRIDPRAVRIGTIVPGRVCFVATWRATATWIGTLSLDADGPEEKRKHVNVFHEARKDLYVEGVDRKRKAEDLDLSFYPRFVHRVEPNDVGEPVMLIGRRFSAGVDSMIDDVMVAYPDSDRIGTLSVSWPFASYGAADGSRIFLIYSKYHEGKHRRFLEVLQAPNFTREKPTELGPPEFRRHSFGGFLLEDEIVFLIQDKQIAVLDLHEKKIEPLCALTEKQGLFAPYFVRSSHYGLLLISDGGAWKVNLGDR